MSKSSDGGTPNPPNTGSISPLSGSAAGGAGAGAAVPEQRALISQRKSDHINLCASGEVEFRRPPASVSSPAAPN